MSKLSDMIEQNISFNEIKAYLDNLSKAEQLAKISYFEYEPFIDAAGKGNLELCKLLIEIAPYLKLAMIKAKDISDNTPYAAFRWAAQKGHLEICKWLIEIAPDLKDEMIKAEDINIYEIYDTPYAAFRSAAENRHYPCAVYIYMMASVEDKQKIMQLDFKNKDIFEQILNHPHLSEMNAASLASSGFLKELSQGRPLSMLKFMHGNRENQKSTYNKTSEESAKAFGILSIAYQDPVETMSTIMPTELIKKISNFMVYNEEPKEVFDLKHKNEESLSK